MAGKQYIFDTLTLFSSTCSWRSGTFIVIALGTDRPRSAQFTITSYHSQTITRCSRWWMVELLLCGPSLVPRRWCHSGSPPCHRWEGAGCGDTGLLLLNSLSLTKSAPMIRAGVGRVAEQDREVVSPRSCFRTHHTHTHTHARTHTRTHKHYYWMYTFVLCWFLKANRWNSPSESMQVSNERELCDTCTVSRYYNNRQLEVVFQQKKCIKEK